MKSLETPVLIVGGGPVGLSTALHLAHNGIESVIVEKHRSTALHPKASYFNVRTMEILGRLGVADELYATALLGAGVSFYTRLTGHRLGGLSGVDLPDYAIACDGVHSSTREELGATKIGPPPFGHTVNTYFQADIESLLPYSAVGRRAGFSIATTKSDVRSPSSTWRRVTRMQSESARLELRTAMRRPM